MPTRPCSPARHRVRPRAPQAILVRLMLPVLLLAASASSGAAAIPGFVTQSSWAAARTPHFTVLTDADAGVATDLARRLERLTQVLARVNPDLRAVTPAHVHVIALRDTAELHAYAFSPLMESFAGFSGSGVLGGHIVIALSVPDSRTAVLYHEYTHLYLRANYATLPLWLNEGLAQYYETVRITDSWAEVGRVQSDKLEWARHQDLMTLDALAGMQTGARAYLRDNSIQRAFYAESWLLTHYLQSKAGGRADRFAAFLAQLRTGAKPRAAFDAAFAAGDWDAVTQELPAYFDRIAFENTRKVEFAGPLANVAIATRELPAGEALQALGALVLSYGPDRQGDALDHLRTAATWDSTSAAGRAWLGYGLEVSGDTSAADLHEARAAALAHQQPEVPLLAGLGLLQRIYQAQGPAQHERAAGWARRAREQFRRALALQGDDPEALAGFGRTFLIEDGPVDTSAIRALARALELAPGRIDVAADLATLAARSGDRATAEAVLRDRVLTTGSRGAAVGVTAALAEAQLRNVQDAASGGRWALADSLAGALAEQASEPDVRSRALAIRSQARRNLAIRDFNRLLDEGVSRSNAGDFDGAIGTLEQARPLAPDGDARLQVGRTIVKVRCRMGMRDATAALKAARYAAASEAIEATLALPLDEQDRASVESLGHDVDARRIIAGADALAKARRLAEARREYQRVLALPASAPLLDHARTRIHAIDRALGAH